jgi:hypothetical protein
MIKPSIFIGSSSEGLDFARSARHLLAPDAEITMWNEGFFRLGATFIETLINSRLRFDFSILVLTPDALERRRGAELFGPSDNVVFELGLFMGALGRERTFVVHQSGTKLPSDLAGVTTANYEWPRADNSKEAALGAACHSIREVMRDLGVAPARASKQVDQVQQQQDILDDRMTQQQMIVNKLVETSMSVATFHHLAGIYLLREYKYWENEKVGDYFRREFYFLKDHGYLGPPALEFDARLNGRNIADLARVMESGKIYIGLRKYDIPSDWLLADPDKRRNLRTDRARELGLIEAGG